MKIRLQIIPLFLLAIIITGCAAGYSSIEMNSINFNNSQNINGLEFSYKYNILNDFDNDRYAGYEGDENIYVVALEIKNSTDNDVNINSRTLKVYLNNTQASIVSPKDTENRMSQNTIPYLLWSLLVLQIHSGTDVTTIPIGIPIALFNLIRSIGGNNSFLDDLVEKNIMNTTIKAGESKRGLLSIYNARYEPLRFEFSSEAKKNDEKPKTILNTTNNSSK